MLTSETNRSRLAPWLLPALLAVVGMIVALVAAKMGQDSRRARDTLKMEYDALYWENQRAKAHLGEETVAPLEEVEKNVAKFEGMKKYPVWAYGYAAYGRQFTAWDGYRYEEIIEQGYYYHQPDATDAEKLQASTFIEGKDPREKNVAWYPLYPLVAHALVTLCHISAKDALTTVSWISCFFAAILLHTFAQRHAGNAGPPRPPRDSALLTVVLFLFGPCSIFLYANFTESLFALLLLSFLLCLQSRWWWRAALIAGVASACRSQGVLFGPVLAFVFLLRNTPVDMFKKMGKALILGMISSLGLICYMIFLQGHFHDPLAFMHTQVYWNVGLSWDRFVYVANPMHAFEHIWGFVTTEPIDWPRLWEASCVVWPPVILYLGRERLTLELSLLGWMFWGLPYVSNSMAGYPIMHSQWMSMGRFMAVLIPAHLIIAHTLARRPRLAPFVLIPSVAAFALFCYLYGNGAWVG